MSALFMKVTESSWPDKVGNEYLFVSLLDFFLEGS